ncbi:MAG: hypothetical protein IPK71_12290 [Myxococcales bacterium]|nr:hypothetical protein [Myxococcales bacterium]
MSLFRTKKAIVGAGLFVCAGVVSGLVACRGTTATAEPSALFLGVSSDLVVDDDFDSVGLFVSVRGEVKLARVEEVKPTGSVALPGTLSITQPSDAATPVHIRVAGYKKGQVIAVRDAVTTVPTGRISLLRLPVQWLSSGSKISGKQRSDTGATPAGAGVTLKADPIGAASNFPEFAPYFEGLVVPCAAGETLVDGTCAPIDVSGLLIPSTNNEHAAQLFGGAVGIDDKGAPQGGSCFPVEECFTESEEVSLESLGADCALPISSVPTSQINFAIQRKTRGEMKFVVPLDYVETPGKHTSGGFYEKEGKYHLPKAICERALGRRDDIAALRVSTTCKSKTAATPTCGPWSAVNTKQQAAPSAGKYFTADAGTDAGDAGDAGRPLWRADVFTTVTDIQGLSGLAVSDSRVWVAGGRKSMGLRIGDPADRVFLPQLLGDAAAMSNYPTGVVAGGDVAAVMFPFGSGNVELVRQHAAQVWRTEPSADSVAAAATTKDDVVIAFTSGTMGTFIKVYSGEQLDGDLRGLRDGSDQSLPSPPVALSFLPGARDGYLTAGVGIYSVSAPEFIGGVTSGTVRTALFGGLPSSISSDVTGALGVLATSDTVIWEVKRSIAGGGEAYALVRTSRSGSLQSTVWVSGLKANGFDVHDVPPIVGDGTYVFFTDGKAIYARSTSDTSSVDLGALAPLHVVQSGSVRGLAYRGGRLYALTSGGQILAGPVQ